MSLYLNNAATTWPKPDCVVEAVTSFMTRGGANLGRGTTSLRDMETMNVVLDCRVRAAELLGGWEDADPRFVTFCANITEALNIVINGFLKPGMSVITSSMEHNAVMRPLRALEAKGVSVAVVQAGRDGYVSPQSFAEALGGGRFDLAVISHASNVCGTIQPLDEIAALCRGAGVPLVLDSAQTAGVLPINASSLGLAALCFTGHKGLMGPQGTGGIIWNPDFAARTAPFITGGTGSYSHIEIQPDDMPDKFESGTPNLPGIAGLNAALGWLAGTGIGRIAARERELGERMLKGLKAVGGIELAGRDTMDGRLPVFPINIRGIDNGILADELSRAGFETRPGLHCAPSAHRTLGTFPGGSLRVSPGWFSTEDGVDSFAAALAEAAEKLIRKG